MLNLNQQPSPLRERHAEVSPVYGTFSGLGILKLKEELQLTSFVFCVIGEVTLAYAIFFISLGQ
jgi:hypothetical protein